MSKLYLDDLKKGVIFSGRISEVHVQNMSKLPFIFFDNLEEVKVSHDISPESTVIGSHIAITLKFKEGMQQQDNLKHRTEALVKSLQYIFWKDLEVTVIDTDGKNYTDILKNVKSE